MGNIRECHASEGSIPEEQDGSTPGECKSSSSPTGNLPGGGSRRDHECEAGRAVLPGKGSRGALNWLRLCAKSCGLSCLGSGGRAQLERAESDSLRLADLPAPHVSTRLSRRGRIKAAVGANALASGPGRGAG